MNEKGEQWTVNELSEVENLGCVNDGHWLVDIRSFLDL
jgi:hypothetical protein